MVMSQKPWPIVRNPYAKPAAKRQRTHATAHAAPRETNETAVPTRKDEDVESTSTSHVKSERDTVNHLSSRGVHGTIPTAIKLSGTHPQLTTRPVMKTVVNPYRKSSKREAPSPHHTLNESRENSIDASYGTRAAQAEPWERDTEGSTQNDQTDLDTSIDWAAAVIELDDACAQTASIPAASCDESNSRFQQSTEGVLKSTALDGVDGGANTESVNGSARSGAPLSDLCTVSTTYKSSNGTVEHAIPGVCGESRQTKPPSAVSLGHDIRPSSWLQHGESRCPRSNVPAAAPVPGTNSVSSNEHEAVPGSQIAGKLPPNTHVSQKHPAVVGNEMPALPPQLVFSPDRVKPVADEHRQTLVKNANLSAPLLNGWHLFSHQKRAILKGLLMRRVILALDMGLGKTLIGCVWSNSFSKTFPDLKIYVICPVSLKKEWKRTAEEATGLKVAEEDKKNETGEMRICSWGKIPTLESTKDSNYVVVCDEAHSMQSLQAARTKNVLQLVASKRCLGVMLLTGTPMKNGKPLNLFPLLKAVRHPFGYHQKAYENHFCDAKEKSYGRGRPVWDANGSSNLPQLRASISSHLLHMTKEQCLTDLPSQTRKVHKVPVSSRSQLQHNNALNDLARLYQNSHNFENGGDVILGAVQRVRQIGSFAKIDATVALAKSVLDEEPAVVIFTSFVGVAEKVHKGLEESGWNGELLTGETPPAKRQAMVDRFQEGTSPVFVCTFGAGGVGLTLTAAHTVILLDRPWTPGDAHQAEDRVRRIGQTKPVKSIWMVAFDLDEQIDAVLEKKSQNSSAVLTQGQQNDSAQAEGAPKISIFRLLWSILPKEGRIASSGIVQSNTSFPPK